MRQGVAGVAAACLMLALTGCGSGGHALAGGGSNAVARESEQETQEAVVIKQSPDKYTWYVKNYVGMNAASVGYTALDGSRRDAYGSGTLKVVFRTNNGAYVPYDTDDESGLESEELKNYKVIGQDLAPNTELKYTFQVDDEGNEYDSLVDCQNYDEIVLALAPVGSDEDAPDLTEIKSSPDKYTRYVKDYVGRNLATCGYLSMVNTYNDHYGSGYVQFDIMAEDGSYVDVTDEAALRSYVVMAQSVDPNTPITMTFLTDPNGNEYSNLVDSQSVEHITLTVASFSE